MFSNYIKSIARRYEIYASVIGVSLAAALCVEVSPQELVRRNLDTKSDCEGDYSNSGLDWPFSHINENFPSSIFFCRNYFLIVSKVPSFSHLREARLALKDIGIRLPNYIPRGSSICIVGYKGREDVSVRYVIGTPKEKASFLSMNITLPSGEISPWLLVGV